MVEKWLRFTIHYYYFTTANYDYIIIQANASVWILYTNHTAEYLLLLFIGIVQFQLNLTHATSGGNGNASDGIQKRKKKNNEFNLIFGCTEHSKWIFRLHGIVQWFFISRCHSLCSFIRTYITFTHTHTHDVRSAATAAATFDQTSKHDKSSDKLRCSKNRCISGSFCFIFFVRYLLYVTYYYYWGWW